MLDFGLQGVDEFALLRENGQVEVVVIVSDKNLVVWVDADTDWVVGDALTSDLSQKVAVVVKDFDAMSSFNY